MGAAHLCMNVSGKRAANAVLRLVRVVAFEISGDKSPLNRIIMFG